MDDIAICVEDLKFGVELVRVLVLNFVVDALGVRPGS